MLSYIAIEISSRERGTLGVERTALLSAVSIVVPHKQGQCTILLKKYEIGNVTAGRCVLSAKLWNECLLVGIGGWMLYFFKFINKLHWDFNGK